MKFNENMKKKFEEGGEKLRKYARKHNFTPSMLSKVLNGKIPTMSNPPIGGAVWKILKQLKRDEYISSLPWAESVDPFFYPYKGSGLGVLDDNGHLVLSEKIIKNRSVPGEFKILLATIDALSSDTGYCVEPNAELAAILSIAEDYLVDTLIYLLGLRCIEITNIDNVRQIRVEELA